MLVTDDMRLENGKLPSYAWPGGYPVYYLASDMGILCPDCANQYQPERDNPDQLMPTHVDINWEDAALFCEHCNKRIESAYAEE